MQKILLPSNDHDTRRSHRETSQVRLFTICSRTLVLDPTRLCAVANATLDTTRQNETKRKLLWDSDIQRIGIAGVLGMEIGNDA